MPVWHDSPWPAKRHRSLPSDHRDLHMPMSEAPGAEAEPREYANAESMLPAHLLDGDEIVILAIKPSLWFVVLTSIRWLLAMLLVLVLAGYGGYSFPLFKTPAVIQGAVILAALRVVFAVMQWVSRLYVLTNRRILRLTGILNIDLFECPLTRIQHTYLTMCWYERLLGLGSISFATAGSGGVEASWTLVNNPLEVHERLRSAIHKARGPGNGV